MRVVHGRGTGPGARASPRSPRSSSPARWRRAAASGEACARQLKGSVLELGGKDPMLVLADADVAPRGRRRAVGRLRQRRPDAAPGSSASTSCARSPTASSPGVVAGAQRLTRRRPAALGDRGRADDLARAARDRARARRRRGRGRRDAGVRRPGRGRPASAAPSTRPAVLTGVTHDMRIMREEIFGPVLPVMVVDSDEEARRAWPTTPGSASAPRCGRATATAASASPRELEAGMVWINDHMYSHGAFQCSWGGVKDSGLGRRALAVRPLRVRRTSSSSPRPRRRSGTSGGTRTTRRWGSRCAAPRICSTGGRPTGAARCARALVPLAQVARRTLRSVVRG